MNSINDALAQYTSHRKQSFPPLIKDIESNRLKTLVEACLAWEKQRPQFNIKAVEKTHQVTLADIDFTVRIDRMDQVGNHVWVIDYKTSMPAAKPWYADRPQDPQLLLYALLDKNINALLFLQLKAGQLTVGGISEENHDLSGLTPIKKGEDWETLQQKWQDQLTMLAEELKNGHCPPTPATASICQSCDYPGLCRIKLG